MNKAADTKQIRSFGFVVGGIFAIIGVWPFIHGHTPRLWAFVVACLLVIPAVVFPGSLRPVYRAWMVLGRILGEINSRIILSLVFFGLMTPIGMARRFWGNDLLSRKVDTLAHTYRKARDSRPASHMKRQY